MYSQNIQKKLFNQLQEFQIKIGRSGRGLMPFVRDWNNLEIAVSLYLIRVWHKNFARINHILSQNYAVFQK